MVLFPCDLSEAELVRVVCRLNWRVFPWRVEITRSFLQRSLAIQLQIRDKNSRQKSSRNEKAIC